MAIMTMHECFNDSVHGDYEDCIYLLLTDVGVNIGYFAGDLIEFE